mmetsp:Transcript_18765/g.27126  ORF Transcript_18765/g.27126 Transcript_18765/m.27126 type:complete len:288 (+) Transcript_18765:34-897(+)
MIEQPPFDPTIHIKSSTIVSNDRSHLIDELRDHIRDNDLYDPLYCTDEQLRLFLIARNYDVNAACKMLIEAKTWRNFRQPHSVESRDDWPSAMSKETETGKVYIPGHDKWGRPLLVFNNQVQNTSCPDAHMTLLSWNMEFAIRQMPSHVDKYCVFMHMDGFSIFNSPGIAEIKETLHIVCTCYPERLGHIIAYQPPSYFSFLLGTLNMFIDPKTMSKLVFISGDISEGSENDQTLRDIIGDTWRDLTGVSRGVLEPNCSPGYSHSEYWPTVLTRVERLRSATVTDDT